MELDVEFRSVSKSYDDVLAVDGIDLEVQHGEFLCLLGPSGCGKTTTLRLIAGFERPDAGRDPRSAAVTCAGSRRTSATSTRSSRATRSSRI